MWIQAFHHERGGTGKPSAKGLPGNAWNGKSDWLVIESDESDGSIVNYVPEIAIVLNVDRDHRYAELMDLFRTVQGTHHGTVYREREPPYGTTTVS